MDLQALGTPKSCVADFCLIPVCHIIFKDRKLHEKFEDLIDPGADRNAHAIRFTRGR